MRKIIIKSNDFYDRIKEPWRFLIAIIIIMPFILAVALESYLLISVIWLLSFTIWRILGFRLSSKSNKKT
jgi:hypothetical protein